MVLGQRGEHLQQPGPRGQVGAGQDGLGGVRRILGKAGQVGGDQVVLAGEVVVQRPLGDVRGLTQLGDPRGVDALAAEQITRGGQDPAARAAAVSWWARC
jgi:hypothetical protein